jgi:NTP pyrophosphatase (non-canonical NTP hydrolase)
VSKQHQKNKPVNPGSANSIVDLQRELDEWIERKYKGMKFSEYEEAAIATAIYPRTHKLLYPALGMASEAGKVVNKVMKLINNGVAKTPDTWRYDIAADIGEMLWYCASLANDLNIPLAQIAAQNKEKLAERKERGTLGGAGDTR